MIIANGIITPGNNNFQGTIMYLGPATGTATTYFQSNGSTGGFGWNNSTPTTLMTLSNSGVLSAGVLNLLVPLSTASGGTGSMNGIGLASITTNLTPSTTNEVQIMYGGLPANSLAVGSTYSIKASGQCTVTTAGATITFRVRLGTASLSGNIVASIANTTVVGTRINFELLAITTIRSIGASGVAIGTMRITNGAATGLTATATTFGPANGTGPLTVAVNTTVQNLIELTTQTTAVSSLPTIYVATIEVDKP